MTQPNLDNLSFEEAYAQLETIVQRLESSNLPLDESLALFEQGQLLAGHCQKMLDGAELRVTQLMGNGSALQAFDE
jgi:exodeoxyribonuclease VII small subunit